MTTHLDTLQALAEAYAWEGDALRHSGKVKEADRMWVHARIHKRAADKLKKTSGGEGVAPPTLLDGGQIAPDLFEELKALDSSLEYRIRRAFGVYNEIRDQHMKKLEQERDEAVEDLSTTRAERDAARAERDVVRKAIKKHEASCAEVHALKAKLHENEIWLGLLRVELSKTEIP